MTVRVSLPGQEFIDGLFFIAFEPGPKGEPETLFGLLNSDRRVVPFQMIEDSRVQLLVRRSIDWVLAGADVPPELIGVPPGSAPDETVELTFQDARTISGQLIRKVKGDVRVSDHLNEAADFFALNTRLGTLLVNKQAMAGMLLVDSRGQLREDLPGGLRGAA